MDSSGENLVEKTQVAEGVEWHVLFIPGDDGEGFVDMLWIKPVKCAERDNKTPDKQKANTDKRPSAHEQEQRKNNGASKRRSDPIR